MKRRLLHQRGAAADPGHRYQMWCKNGIGEDICIGYSDCATAFQQMIERHPVWHSWRAVDRRPPKSFDPASETSPDRHRDPTRRRGPYA